VAVTADNGSDLPDVIAGLDMVAALGCFGGNRKALKAFLGKFAHVQADAVSPIRQAADQGDFDNAQRLAHTLKGLVGTIGATQLAEAAHAVEDAAREQQTEGLPALLNELDEQHQVVLAGLVAVQPDETDDERQAAPPEQAVDPDVLNPLLARLTERLEDGDPGAADVLAELMRVGLPASMRAQLVELAERVERYDFEGALERVELLACASAGEDQTGETGN